MNNHHNTTGLSGDELKAKQAKAVTQDQKVLAFFLARPGQEFSACQVWREVMDKSSLRGTLLTSIRRSHSNLKNSGDIVKTNNKTIGYYGDKVHTYKLTPTPSTKPEQTSMFK